MNMKNKQTTWLTKMIAILFLSPLALGFTSCGEKEVEPTETIMQIVNNTKQEGTNANTGLDSLAKYLGVYPDLVETLAGTGNFTLFAPTNQAFINLLATPGFPQNIASINPAVIKGVLQYHVLASQVLSGELTPTGSGTGLGTAFSAINPCSGAGTQEFVKINENGTLLTGSTNKAIVIREADKKATNGVVHIVETVLIPFSVEASLTPILVRLAGTVLLGSDFSYLAALVSKADCATANAADRIGTILAGNAQLTAFLPPNGVFEAAAGGAANVPAFLDGINAATARAILLNHIVDGAITLEQLPESFTTRLGATVNVIATEPSQQVPTGRILRVAGSETNVPIAIPDIQHANGRGHVILGILMPPAQ
jgi:uncharacterized surface protein with fasciclin (FAS1) repeats